VIGNHGRLLLARERGELSIARSADAGICEV